MNCPHNREPERCPLCAEILMGMAASFRIVGPNIAQHLARCEHDHATRLGLTWCNFCGAMRNRGASAWTVPRITAIAKALDARPNPPGVIDATYEGDSRE